MRLLKYVTVFVFLLFSAPSIFSQVEMSIGIEPNFTFSTEFPLAQTAGSLSYDFGSIAVESTTKVGAMGDIMLAIGLGLCYDLPIVGDWVLRLSCGSHISGGAMAEGFYWGGYFQAKYKNDRVSHWYVNTGLDLYNFIDRKRTLILPTIYVGGGYSFEFLVCK